MRQKILVVDDDGDCHEIVLQLRGLRYGIIQADSCAKGVQKAVSETPDLIIMELGLGGVSGVEATRWLKEDPRTKHIPIIVHTASQEGSYTNKALQAGAAEVLTKPVSTGVLEEAIQRSLKSSSQP